MNMNIYIYMYMYIHIYVLGVHMYICVYMFYIDIYIYMCVYMCVYMGFSVLEIRGGQLEIVQGSTAPPAPSVRKGFGAVDSIEV